MTSPMFLDNSNCILDIKFVIYSKSPFKMKLSNVIAENHTVHKIHINLVN